MFSYLNVFCLFQANFISELPDIQLLVKTLIYLNLSFNEFRVSDCDLLPSI